MKKIGTIIVIAFAIWFVYAKWEDLDANTLATVFTGLVVIYGYSETKKRETVARHFIEKKNAYGDFINFICKISERKNQGKNSFQEMVNKTETFKRALITWGGKDIIDAYNRYTRTANPATTDKDLFLLVDDLLRAIRKDLGHNDSKLKRGELVGMFLDNESKEKLDKLI